jgi:NAD(P)-dependent dehydrogenase (short-subunit alcohol dehydrogenase family)
MKTAKSVFRLDDKVAMVVGAASGIGRASALALGDSGASVACADMDASGAQKVADEITGAGGKAAAFPLDIRKRENITAAIEGIQSRFQKIDVLVATPAINVRKRLVTYTDDELDRVIDLNLKATFRVTQAVAQVMAEGGSIILTSSIRSVTVEPGQGVYAATKAALVQLARGFAVELAHKNIRVNALAPGVVETPLTEPIKKNADWYSAYANRNALKRWAQPEEMAWPVVFLASAASSYVTGTVLFVDGGWTGIDGRYEPPLLVHLRCSTNRQSFAR